MKTRKKRKGLKVCICLIMVMALPWFTPVAFSDIYFDNPKGEKMSEEYLEIYLQLFPNLEYAEVMSAINRESGGNEKLIIYEPNVHDNSYGPLMVRGKTSREYGYKGPLKDLCSWSKGLYYGMLVMSTQKKRFKHRACNKKQLRDMMFASYQAGGCYYKYVDGKRQFINQKYVNYCENKYYIYKKKWSQIVMLRKQWKLMEEPLLPLFTKIFNDKVMVLNKFVENMLCELNGKDGENG